MKSKKINTPKMRFSEFSEPWAPTALGDIAKFSKGKGISKSDINLDGETYCVRYGELYTTYGTVIDLPVSKTDVPQKDLLLSKGGEVIVPASGETSEDIATASVVLRAGVALGGDLNIIESPLDGMFLASYLSEKKKFSLASMAQGNSVVHLYYSQIQTLNIGVPTGAEQEKISLFLKAINEKISLLADEKATLERYKRGCAQKIFSQEIRFKDDGGRDFPNWEAKILGDVATLVNGLTYSPKDIRESGILVLRSSNVQDGEIDLEDNVYVDVKIDPDKKTQVGDILLCVRNGSRRLIGKNAIVRVPLENATHGAFMSVLRGKLNRFLYQLLQTPIFFREVHKNLGATINSINGSDLREMKFLMPTDHKEMEKISQFLSAIDEKITLAGQELELAQSFKKGLLQKMFV
ncbi:restriction endonuclease subunit S [Sulfitobacter pontiacus]|uniref:restriction endonuclease subunit S n=1 Tax=Sulfitobacter pontiacus TaxID=60137 RepID=UPI0030EC05BF